MSERTSERSGGRERSEQSGASERMSERTSEWPSTYVSILVCSRPQCTHPVAFFHVSACPSAIQRIESPNVITVPYSMTKTLEKIKAKEEADHYLGLYRRNKGALMVMMMTLTLMMCRERRGRVIICCTCSRQRLRRSCKFFQFLVVDHDCTDSSPQFWKLELTSARK